MDIGRSIYGNTKEGKQVNLYTLTNKSGMMVKIIDFGGIITSILAADRDGKFGDVTLGYQNLEGYLNNKPYFGAIIGRHANRIEEARFELNGTEYKLYKNNGENHLHGGLTGFDKVVWDSEIITGKDNKSLLLSYFSKDMEEGYPGNLKVQVTYSLTEENELVINYFAVSDKDTVINLTNHAYFNLAGHSSGDIKKHKLRLISDKFTNNDSSSIPTGEIMDVKDTPMDFTSMKELGPGLESSFPQIVQSGGGYDVNYVLKGSTERPELAGEVYEENSGRLMEVYTTKPGIQLYTGNYLEPMAGYKDNAKYKKWSGFCLETQFYPNAMKHKHFPSPILKKGEKYQHTTIYKFSAL